MDEPTVTRHVEVTVRDDRGKKWKLELAGEGRVRIHPPLILLNPGSLALPDLRRALTELEAAAEADA